MSGNAPVEAVVMGAAGLLRMARFWLGRAEVSAGATAPDAVVPGANAVVPVACMIVAGLKPLPKKPPW